MQQRWLVLVGGILLACPVVVFAEAVQDAAALKSEAMGILQGASSSSTDPKAYASAMVKLEQAQKLLEQAKADDTPLAQEVTTALFWARKFANVQSLNEADRLRRSGGTSVASVNPPPVAPPVTPAVPPAKPATDAGASELPGLEGGVDAAQLAAAKRKYEEAERFAKAQANNDFIVALRWFQVADELSGTDFAVKALSNARIAQERYAAKVAAEKATAEGKPALEGPEYDLIKEGDTLLVQDKFDEAVRKYEASAQLKDNMLAHRKLGHALFDRAQVLKDSLLPQFDAAQNEYRQALAAASREVRTSRGQRYTKVNWNDPRLVAAKRNGVQLTAKAKDALRQYDRAFLEFGKVLGMAEGGKDLDAAGHQALCYSVRGDKYFRLKARAMLATVLQEYQPQNDMERTLYEFCKTELKRISTR